MSKRTSSLQAQRLVWASALASLGVCAAFPWLSPTNEAVTIGGRDPNFVGTCLVLASLLAVTFILWRTIKLVPLREGRLSPIAHERAAHLARVSLLIWTTAQAVGLYGLCLYLMVEQSAYLYGFVLCAAVLLSIHAPQPLPSQARVPRLHHPGSRLVRQLLVSGRPQNLSL